MKTFISNKLKIYQSYLDNKVCVDKREKNDDEDDKDNEIVPIKCFVF